MPNICLIYAVVYGSSNDEYYYFDSLNKAVAKLDELCLAGAHDSNLAKHDLYIKIYRKGRDGVYISNNTAIRHCLCYMGAKATMHLVPHGNLDVITVPT